ncbi:MAG: helix-turn-helix domain-containing protein [bacterium]
MRVAGAVFVRHGVAETRVEDILQAAAIGRATFYRQFRSKDDVLRALESEWRERVASILTTNGRRSVLSLESLASLLESQIALAVANGALWELFGLESLKRGSPLADARELAVERIATVVHREQSLARRERADPWLIRGYVAAYEAIVRHLVRNGLDGPEHRARAVRAMVNVVRAVTEGVLEPSSLAPPPTATRAARAAGPRSRGRARQRRRAPA